MKTNIVSLGIMLLTLSACSAVESNFAEMKGQWMGEIYDINRQFGYAINVNDIDYEVKEVKGPITLGTSRRELKLTKNSEDTDFYLQVENSKTSDFYYLTGIMYSSLTVNSQISNRDGTYILLDAISVDKAKEHLILFLPRYSSKRISVSKIQTNNPNPLSLVQIGKDDDTVYIQQNAENKSVETSLQVWEIEDINNIYKLPQDSFEKESINYLNIQKKQQQAAVPRGETLIASKKRVLQVTPTPTKEKSNTKTQRKNNTNTQQNSQPSHNYDDYNYETTLTAYDGPRIDTTTSTVKEYDGDYGEKVQIVPVLVLEQ